MQGTVLSSSGVPVNKVVEDIHLWGTYISTGERQTTNIIVNIKCPPPKKKELESAKGDQ